MLSFNRILLFITIIVLFITSILFSQPQTSVSAITATLPPMQNVALNKPVRVSHQQSTNPGPNAVDGNTETRWSAYGFPAWLIVDLGASYPIYTTTIMAYQNRAYQYKIEFSTDGTTYKLVTDRRTNTDPYMTNYHSYAAARYIRLTITGVAGNITSWSAITEFRVMGVVSGPTKTPTPTNTVCPFATSVPPPAVEPVTSPTNALSQIIRVSGTTGSWEKVTVEVTANGAVTLYEDTTAPFEITINLQADTTHNLRVLAKVPLSTTGCRYGGYTVSTTTDRYGNPLTIVQTSAIVPTNTRTPSRTTTACACLPTRASTATFTPVPGISAWNGNGYIYQVGDLVTYNGRIYRCIQSHTSQPGWNPEAAPSLWQLQ